MTVVALATADDLDYVMATERLAGYETLVGRWEREIHEAAMVDGHHAYFIARDDDHRIGFAILRGWVSPERVTHLKRIAVAVPGRGYGKDFLRLIVEPAFGETHAHRLWLGVFPDNARARRAYEQVGFCAEGIARGSAFFGGVFRDELIMALLRSDWEAGIALPPSQDS
jgi:RimJ/RimL family protein N-acetyltransferase